MRCQVRRGWGPSAPARGERTLPIVPGRGRVPLATRQTRLSLLPPSPAGSRGAWCFRAPSLLAVAWTQAARHACPRLVGLWLRIGSAGRRACALQSAASTRLNPARVAPLPHFAGAPSDGRGPRTRANGQARRQLLAPTGPRIAAELAPAAARISSSGWFHPKRVARSSKSKRRKWTYMRVLQPIAGGVLLKRGRGRLRDGQFRHCLARFANTPGLSPTCQHHSQSKSPIHLCHHSKHKSK